ncbi:c-type cytochrome [Bradyrhizobium icense]|uniref:Cytochrome C n=1 Tax=Bradyrhizobium icense TaxID=1274631 RepID=A0A1B1UDN2_9BRAD|nr:cytochrome c family protein [Bradyrhizobium icense]ANW00851.1 cytochrome C [Bradyrhizobium icense]
MNSFELNKLLGAILGICTILVAVNIATDAIFAPEEPEKPGYEIAVQEPTAANKDNVEEPAEPEPIEQRLARASVERGMSAAKKCAACHTFDEGGQHRVGPNLWGIVDRPRASTEGFKYSTAMKDKGGAWTFEELDRFLANPRGYVPGTSMTFAGISRARERANVIEYLRTLAENPVARPKTAESPPQTRSNDKDVPPNLH